MCGREGGYTYDEARGIICVCLYVFSTAQEERSTKAHRGGRVSMCVLFVKSKALKCVGVCVRACV